MRVISGTAKGRRLRPVPGTDTRPITDRVKEALFDIVGPDVVGLGLVGRICRHGCRRHRGLEPRRRLRAFHRPAPRCRSKPSDANLLLTGLRDRAEVRQANAYTLMAARPDRQFDYVYVAPPQYQGLWSRALTALDANDGLVEPGRLDRRTDASQGIPAARSRASGGIRQQEIRNHPAAVLCPQAAVI